MSNVNAEPGEHRANLVFVGVGDAGRVRIYNLAGSAHVVADLVGYVSRRHHRTASSPSRRTASSTPVPPRGVRAPDRSRRPAP